MHMPTLKVTDANFDDDVMDSNLPVVVDFWAEWCGPCLAMAPLLEEIADELIGQVVIAKLDVDTNAATTEAYDIHSVPAFKIFKNGVLLDSDIGLMSKEMFKTWVLATI
jgi:thioredoxin 1